MKELIMIGLGGGIGAIFRFLLSRGTHTLLGLAFPYGTLLVNILGSFLMGFLAILLLDRIGDWSQLLRAFLLIGLLGGFTTFSTFSYEVVDLWENGEGIKLAFYILFTLILCFGGTFLGLILGRKI
jgi:CrcB protein